MGMSMQRISPNVPKTFFRTYSLGRSFITPLRSWTGEIQMRVAIEFYLKITSKISIKGSTKSTNWYFRSSMEL